MKKVLKHHTIISTFKGDEKVANSLAYLATPYSKWKLGPEAAFIEASKLAARLLVSGVKVYSPIAHTHPLAYYGGLDLLDLSIWLPFDEAMMERCDVLIVAHMDGWQESKGIAHEIEFFKRAEKPIFDLDPETLVMTKRTKSGHFDKRMHLTLNDMKGFSGPPRTEMPPLAMPDPKGQ